MQHRMPAAERLDYLASGGRPWLLLILLSLALFLPGIAGIPPVDRDEARYVQATRQMLETGDPVEIRFQDEARNKKPAGIYWLQAISVDLLSDGEATSLWPYRLVSVLGAMSAVLLTFLFGAEIFDRRTALIGAALLASTILCTAEAHLATTDAAQLAAAVAAQGALGMAYLSNRRSEPLPLWVGAVFWFAQGAAILLKGPVVPALSLLTVLGLLVADQRARWFMALRPEWGVPLVLVMVAPWLMLIEIQTQGAFLREAIGHDLLGKVAGAQEAHGAPPLYYLLLTPATFWPASLFLGAAGVWAWRSRRLPAARLLLAWILPFWLIIELVPTKLPHYALPLYPALALLAAKAVVALGEEGMVEPRAWLRPIFPWLWALVGLALSAALLLLPLQLGAGLLYPGGLAIAVALAVAWHILRRERLRLRPSSALVAVLASLLILAPGFEGILPELDPVWLSRSAARLVKTARQPGMVVSSSGYAEPSLVFLLGTATELVPAEVAAADLTAGKVGLSLVEARQDAAFHLALAGKPAHALGQVSGFDYSNGKWMTLTLYGTGPA
ncbi:MAG TPA: glycosyltransferase family 39 protein [Aliidongia sp.]|nr:glycosyltransferase family 39 protein [Aliidongia sp.]